MKLHQKIKLMSVLLVALLVFEGCLMKNPYQTGTTEPSETTTAPVTPLPPDRFVPNFTYASETAKRLEPWLATGNAKYLRLINKEVNDFESDYPPANLVTLNKTATNYGKEVQIDARVERALYAMLAEMQHNGITDLRITSGYRDYEYQELLYKAYQTNEQQGISAEAYAFFGAEYIKANYLDQGIDKLTAADAEQVANYYSARPGTSEHHTGLCVDFVTTDNPAVLNESFENTQAFAWLAENAYRFGFILRYPKGKTDITGYIYEPWHYRYVGRDAAAEIYAQGLTLEEYLGRE